MAFVLLLLLYLLIYQADELVIFFVAVSSLKASKLEEKHGRILKLIGGMFDAGSGGRHAHQPQVNEYGVLVPDNFRNRFRSHTPGFVIAPGHPTQIGHLYWQ